MQIEYVPDSHTTLTDPDDIKNMEKILELLENNDDVQDVWHNAVFEWCHPCHIEKTCKECH